MEEKPTSESVPTADRQLSANAEEPPSQISIPDAPSKEAAERQEDSQYLTGIKFVIVMVSLTLVFFLVMLDLSIIATVSQALLWQARSSWTPLTYGAGDTSYYHRFSFFA